MCKHSCSMRILGEMVGFRVSRDNQHFGQRIVSCDIKLVGYVYVYICIYRHIGLKSCVKCQNRVRVEFQCIRDGFGGALSWKLLGPIIRHRQEVEAVQYSRTLSPTRNPKP